MNLRSVRKQFLDRLTLAGFTLEQLNPLVGIELMLRFYDEERVDRCPLDEDGDMLLFQWGTYDWGQGERFDINITRQLMTAEVAGDERVRQLSLTFHYPASPALEAVGDGDHWCDTPEGLDNFRTDILTGPALKAVETLSSIEIDLTFDEM